MIKCHPDEIPCCDFCIYCIHAPTEPIGCSLHNDKKHNDEALGRGYCEDFHCFNAGKDNHADNN